MDREIKVFRLIVLALFLGSVSLALFTARAAVFSHSHGRDPATQLVPLVLTVFFLILAAFSAWLAYLMFFRFLTGIETLPSGYLLLTRALQQEQATQLSAVRKVGGLEGPNELTVIRADSKYWVCLTGTFKTATSARNDGFQVVSTGA